MNKDKLLRFVCPFCKASRALMVDNDVHQHQVVTQANGLLTYSDLHSCDKGILNLLDLRVDHDLNVRSIDKFKMVNIQKSTGSSLPIPKPNLTSRAQRSISNTGFFLDNLDLCIESDLYGFDLMIGRISEEDSNHVISSMEDIKLCYSGPNDEGLNTWFKILVDVIEISPPIELGVLLEAFQYIFECHPNYPTQFDREIIKTIFVAHEVFVDPIFDIEEEFFKLLQQHEIEEELASEIHSYISLNGGMSVLDLTKITKSLILTIYYSMLLEKHQLTAIQRPGVLETPFYLQA